MSRGARTSAARNASAVLLCLALAALLGPSIGAERTLLFVPLLAIPVAAAIVWRPQLALQGVLVVAFTVDYAVYLFNLPSALTYLLDGLILILACAVLVQAALRKDVHWGSPLIVIWILLVVIAAIVNPGKGLVSLQSLVAYALFPLLYLAVINMEMGPFMERRIAKILFVLAVVQAPVTLIQKYGFGVTNVDRIGGTLGRAATPEMAVLMAGLLAFLLIYLACHRRWRFFPLILIPIIPLLMGEAKAGFFLGSLGAAIVLVLLIWQGASWKAIGATAACVILPLVVVYAAYRYYPALVLSDAGNAPNFLRALFTKQGFVQYMSGYRAGQANRVTAYGVVWNNLNDSRTLAIGLGPGAMSTSTLLGQAADPAVSGLMWMSSAGRYLMETGLVGLSSFCLAIIYLIAQSLRLVRSLEIYQRVLGMTFIVAGILFLIGGFYTSAWHSTALAVSFWTLAGLAFRETRRFRTNGSG